MQRLPRLIGIADRFVDEAVREQAAAAVQAGLPWVHLRDHTAGTDEFGRTARMLVARLRALNDRVLISVNTRLYTAQTLNTHLHVGRRGPTPEAARGALGSRALIGYSAHAEDTKVPAGTDYLFYSPIFPTRSKPGHPGLGVEALQETRRRLGSIPVFALGGVTPGRVAPCLEAGVHGVAVLSGIFGTADPARATETYLEALGRALSNGATTDQQNTHTSTSP